MQARRTTWTAPRPMAAIWGVSPRGRRRPNATIEKPFLTAARTLVDARWSTAEFQETLAQWLDLSGGVDDRVPGGTPPGTDRRAKACFKSNEARHIRSVGAR